MQSNLTRVVAAVLILFFIALIGGAAMVRGKLKQHNSKAEELHETRPAPTRTESELNRDRVADLIDPFAGSSPSPFSENSAVSYQDDDAPLGVNIHSAAATPRRSWFKRDEALRGVSP